LVVLAASEPGLECVRVLAERSADVSLVVLDRNDRGNCNAQIAAVAEAQRWQTLGWHELMEREVAADAGSRRPHLGVSAWWPYLLRRPLIDWPVEGWINLHPSLLPFNRGKHPNFWSLVEGTPVGATIHFIDQTIDGGDIVAQAELGVSWTDTGESVYKRTQQLCVRLFAELAPVLVEGAELPRRRQPVPPTPVHFAAELDPASEIRLDEVCTARKLLNLMRARTFPPHPGAYFHDAGERFVVRVSIERCTDE
jgi:methionyl-tRNA formyltransferase